jgi:hypothetical protein
MRPCSHLMNAAVPDCPVTGYEPLAEGLKPPDANDRHVLAIAIKAGAQVIVTRNLKTFLPAICSRGALMRNRLMTSYLIRSVSTAELLRHVSGRSLAYSAARCRRRRAGSSRTGRTRAGGRGASDCVANRASLPPTVPRSCN